MLVRVSSELIIYSTKNFLVTYYVTVMILLNSGQSHLKKTDLYPTLKELLGGGKYCTNTCANGSLGVSALGRLWEVSELQVYTTRL